MDALTDLVGSIYDAVEDDEQWSEVLHGLASLTGSRSAGMFRVEGAGLGFERSWNMPGDFMREFDRDYVGIDPRVKHALAHPVGSILSDAQPELRRRMVAAGIDDLARRHDLPYTMSSLFRRDRSGLWALYISRSTREGEPGSEQVERFRFVLGHVERVIALRLRLAEAELQLHAVGRQAGALSPALILINRDRRLRWACPQGESLLSGRLLSGRMLLSVHEGCVRLRAEPMDRKLDGMIRHAHAEQNRLHLPIIDGGVAYSLEVLPFRSRGWLAARDSLILLVLRQVPAGLVDIVALTLRQRLVLDLVAQGLHNKEIAARLNVSVNTVRNHIRGVFERMGARSRTECVAIARRSGMLGES